MAGKDRKKELARQRYDRQRARREAEAAAARKKSVIGGSVATAVVILGVAGLAWFVMKDDGGDDTLAAPSAAPTAAPGECLYTETGDASKDVGLPPVKPAYDGAVDATVKTTVGDLTFSLDGEKAPCTVNSFAHLAAEGYFDGTSCHRLTENVLQCGDPSASGSGGPGYQFANENTEGAQYKKGVLAMANAGADTNGSQFFIVYKDWDDLPPDYTVFGTVTKGLEEVEKVGKDGSEPAGDGKPKTKVDIKSISIEKN